MDFSVYKADDGRAVVKSKFDDFVASYKYGQWVNDMAFDPYELLELPLVEDQQKAMNIVKEAKRCLSRW